MRIGVAVLATFLSLLCQRPTFAGFYNPADPVKPVANLEEFFRNQLPSIRGYTKPDGLTVTEETANRKDYLRRVEDLRRKEGRGPLPPAEQVALAAYLIRLGETEEAIRVLETAIRVIPREDVNHFYAMANLGTAYQRAGDLATAQLRLEDALSLAPPANKPLEQFHYLLVQQRRAEQVPPGRAPLDRLFPMEFVGESGKWEVNKWADKERKKLTEYLQKQLGKPPTPEEPTFMEHRVGRSAVDCCALAATLTDAIHLVQQLLLALPEDARLHWLLGELANAGGDVKNAYRAMDLAVNDFRLSTPELKERRLALQQVQPKPEQIKLEFPPEGGAAPVETNPFAKFGRREWIIIGMVTTLAVGLLLLQLRQIARRRAQRT